MPKAIKSYPHFDAPITPAEVEQILSNPKRIAQNPFFPFLSYDQTYQPYRQKTGARPEKKSRPIAYASRRDAAIYEHYRGIISESYEQRISALGIEDVPIAYRKIASNSGGGKCNIDFAKDAFDEIIKKQKCRVFVVDISKYFPSICHSNLKKVWCDLLNFERLPDDHFAVFSAITKYSYIDRAELYRELGYIGEMEEGGRKRTGYLKARDEIPKQLCAPKTLREIIHRRKAKGNPILLSNLKSHGIPQGAPISDVLANMNLINFDKEVSDYVRSLNGYFVRYSDDILIILPASEAGKDVVALLRGLLKKSGEKLAIKDTKVSIIDFDLTNAGKKFTSISGIGANGLEYLGFRFDGTHVYLKDKTLSNFYRNLARGAKAHAHALRARYEGKDKEFLLEHLHIDKFLSRYGRVEDFHSGGGYKNWTFWTYVRRARSIFGPCSRPINNQLRGYKNFARERLHRAISE